MTPPLVNEPPLPLLASLFPSLQTLGLPGNALTAESLQTKAPPSLIFVSMPVADQEAAEVAPQLVRKGLKHPFLATWKLPCRPGWSPGSCGVVQRQ